MTTGFQSPAVGYEDNGLDLNRLLVKHPFATVFMWIDSCRYQRMGIYNGDLLVIDRARKIVPNSLVVYSQDGEFRLGRFYSISSEATVTGVVVHVIHKVREI